MKKNEFSHGCFKVCLCLWLSVWLSRWFNKKTIGSYWFFNLSWIGFNWIYSNWIIWWVKMVLTMCLWKVLIECIFEFLVYLVCLVWLCSSYFGSVPFGLIWFCLINPLSVNSFVWLLLSDDFFYLIVSP
jgi:hypothetical protein